MLMRADRSNPFRARRGTAMTILALSLPLLVGVMALTLDGGVLMIERRHAQSVADASSLAAAYSLYNNYSKNKGLDSDGAAAKAARAIASDNGYINDGDTSTVTVNIPPLTGQFIGTAGYAEVNVQYNQPRYFSALWGAGTMSVTARTVARGIASPSSPAILLLDPSMKASLNVTGNGGISATGGSIVVDSNNLQSGVLTGAGGASAPNINFYGSYSTSGSGQFLGNVQSYIKPTPDPLSGLPVPNPAIMTVQSNTQYKISAKGTYTLQPGLYKGGIAISAPGPGLITLSPGIYYMQGGGFSNSGSLDMTGTGVMIYNAPQQNSDQVKLTGSGNLTLSAPTSGTYKGITIYQDRTATAVVNVTGNGGMSLSGTIYSAKAEIDVTGNGGTNVVGSQIIANNMKVTGNGPVNVIYTASGSPVRDTRIVE